MTGLEVTALVLCLFLASQLVAIPLGAAIGKRVSGARWLAIVVAGVALLVVSFQLLTTGK